MEIRVTSSRFHSLVIDGISKAFLKKQIFATFASPHIPLFDTNPIMLHIYLELRLSFNDRIGEKKLLQLGKSIQLDMGCVSKN